MLQLLTIPEKLPSQKIVPPTKATLGQYMTPPAIARFMASLFAPRQGGELRLLDAGAGQGSLSCAFLQAWREGHSVFSSGKVTLFEIDSTMVPTLDAAVSRALDGLPAQHSIAHEDFIERAACWALLGQRLYTHAILNPPYKKIHSQSRHRQLLRGAGIETGNLYAAFVALALFLLEPGGQLVAIIPRSFCNGPYFKEFRKFLLRLAAIRRIHLFNSRTKAFSDDKVLQENCILTLERDVRQGDVIVSASTDATFSDMMEIKKPFTAIINPADKEHFIHISLEPESTQALPFQVISLKDLELNVSTGPVVDFRLKEWLSSTPQQGDVPLLYPAHFNGHISWPKPDFKKSNAIRLCPETEKYLYPNGFYVVVRRMSSKEEARRINAHVVDPAAFVGMEWLGFENHLNVFHSRKQGVSKHLAWGLACYLNSSLVDTMFRRFNGHTQVNATDLRALTYPPHTFLARLGRWAESHGSIPPQETIDQRLEVLCREYT